jgi:hypothetical protein
MTKEDDTFRQLKKTPEEEFAPLLLEFLLDSGFVVEPGMTDVQFDSFLESHGWTLSEVHEFINKSHPFD